MRLPRVPEGNGVLEQNTKRWLRYAAIDLPDTEGMTGNMGKNGRSK